MIAEKLHAMATPGDRNSGVKDRWDVACLARRFAFDGDTLRTAIAETFRHCRTSLTGGRPPALLAGHYDDHEAPARGQRWREMRRQIGTAIDGPDRLVEAGEELRRRPRPWRRQVGLLRPGGTDRRRRGIGVGTQDRSRVGGACRSERPVFRAGDEPSHLLLNLEHDVPADPE